MGITQRAINLQYRLERLNPCQREAIEYIRKHGGALRFGRCGWIGVDCDPEAPQWFVDTTTVQALLRREVLYCHPSVCSPTFDNSFWGVQVLVKPKELRKHTLQLLDILR